MCPVWQESHLHSSGLGTCGFFGRGRFSPFVPVLNGFGRRSNLTLFALASVLALEVSVWAKGDVARADEKRWRVVMLYPYSNLFPISVIAGEAARRRMSERSREPLEFYSDFLDLGRFSGEAHETCTARYLIDKYRDRKPDVVIALVRAGAALHRTASG